MRSSERERRRERPVDSGWLWPMDRQLSQELPCAPDVPLLRSDVADGEAEDVAAIELRVREEHLAGGVDSLEDLRVQVVEYFLMNAGWREAEADEREWDRRDDLPIRIGMHPVGELSREGAVWADAGGAPLRSEATNDHPQLERTEAAAELHAVIHEVDHRLALGGHEVFVHERERLLEHVGSGREERRAIKRGEEPLVRIDDEGIGVIDAIEDVSHLRHDRGNAAIGTVDMDPDRLATTDLGNGGDWIDARGARRADGGDAGERQEAV